MDPNPLPPPIANRSRYISWGISVTLESSLTTWQCQELDSKILRCIKNWCIKIYSRARGHSTQNNSTVLPFKMIICTHNVYRTPTPKRWPKELKGFISCTDMIYKTKLQLKYWGEVCTDEHTDFKTSLL